MARYGGAVMHRRGVVLLLGFLVAVVVVGGSGVRAPWSPAHDPVAAVVSPYPGPARVAAAPGRLRVE